MATDVSFTFGPVATPPTIDHPATATEDGCWTEAVPSGIAERLEAWLDVDGDDEQTCREAFRDPSRCGPDDGEPQGQVDFAVKPTGTTHVELTFADGS